jgi:hypothetical protein
MATRGSWKPGQSGNPRGRPPTEHSLSNALREVGDRIDPKTGRRNVMRVAEVAYELALKGEIPAIVFIAERLEGKAVSLIDMQVRSDNRDDVRLFTDAELERKIAEEEAKRLLVHEGTPTEQ